MIEPPEITGHYGNNDLLAQLRAALAADGADPDRPSLAALAPYDHFHGRGIEATAALADMLPVAASDHILDVGSGIGGPARYLADRFGCRVTGIDLTPSFCAIARTLTSATGLADRVAIEQGDALAMRFAEGSFDGAYSMNVAMNIADRAGLYREIRRVLKPGAWLALSELAQGPNPGPDFPVPWARSAATSFLVTPEETRQRLEAAGFTIVSWRDTTEEALAFADRAREAVARGEKPPHRAVRLIHGELAGEMARNVLRGIGRSSLVPIEILARR